VEQDSTAYLQNLETATRSTIDQRDISTLRIPGLTILAHADPDRIGERAALTALASGEEILLSRLEPVFAVPGDSRRRALADPHLSRRPLRLIPVPGGGARLLAKGSKTRVEANGILVEDWREFSATELDLGVVLLLADKVTLLLHTLSPALPQVRHFGLVGESDNLVTVRQQVARVADLDVPALLRGETGTGKELVARAIHDASARSAQPFVAVNMGAIPPTLAAAELFGAAKGAFTGADRQRSGYFTRAQGGTLFLDEIGETPPETQVLLLRALETGIIQPVGSEASKKIDVRILAATDARLEAEIDAGRFRAPLLHRLSGYEIRLPPLRDRRDDIGRLLVHFLRLELESFGEAHCLETEAGKRPWLPAAVVARLATHLWPGNVRQLRNVARQLVIDNRGAPHLRITEQIETMLEETAPVPLRHVAAMVGASLEEPPRAAAERPAAKPRAVLKTLVSIETVEPADAGGSGAPRETDPFHLLTPSMERHGGREVESGERFRLLLFERPVDGLGCVADYFETLREAARSPGAALGVRAGIHLGEVLVRHTGPPESPAVFEVGNVARSIVVRLSSQAADGQALLTRSAFDLARQAASEGHRLAGSDVLWLRRGTLCLREDQDEATEVFEVAAVGTAGSAAVEDTRPAYRPPGEVSEEELLAALKAHGFRLQPTAAALAISRTSLYALIDRSPNVRKARDLGREEIERCRRRQDGNLDAMAAELEVSRKGLSRRMTQLGF